MNYKNLLKYSLTILLLISLIEKLYVWIYIYVLEESIYFHFIILEILAILFLIFLVIKNKKIETSLNINFNHTLKYSLLFILFTSFFEKFCYLILNIQTPKSVGFFQLLFNPINTGIIFSFCLVFLILKIRKTKISFNVFLIYILTFIITNCVLKYGNDLIFHYLNKIIHPVSQTQKAEVGLMNLVTNFSGGETFERPSFNIITELFIYPFDNIIFSLKSFNITMFLTSILYSKLILSTFIIFYYSSYVLFVNHNKKGLYALIPIKKDLIFLEITKKPLWWLILLLIPFIRIVPKYLINVELSKLYQKKNSYSYGMTLMPWLFYGMVILNDKTK